MRYQEGLPVSLIDESKLDSSGILRGGVGCTAAYGLPEAAVALFLEIAAAGPEGLAKSRVSKGLQPELNAHLIPLELQGLVAWERDNRGRLAYLVLTWKGEEAIAAAKPRVTKPAALLRARRRALEVET